MNLVGAQNQTTGFKSGAITQVDSLISALGSPWTVLSQQFPYRIVNPKNAYGSAAPGSGAPWFSTPGFLDSAILAVWNAYQAPTWLTIQSVNANGYTTLYGQVDANQNVNFYTSQSTASTLVATIPSPISGVSQTWPQNQTNAAAAATTNAGFRPTSATRARRR